MLKELLCRNPEVGIFLETLREKVYDNLYAQLAEVVGVKEYLTGEAPWGRGG